MFTDQAFFQFSFWGWTDEEYLKVAMKTLTQSIKTVRY